MRLAQHSKPSFFIAALLALLALPLSAHAQEQAATPKVKIDWQDGPTVGKLGALAEIKVPEGYRFAGADGTRKFLELTENPPSGAELGVLIPERKESDPSHGFWFVIFEFRNIGYVKDDDRDKLNADALLKELQTNTEEGNKERAKRGWPASYYHASQTCSLDFRSSPATATPSFGPVTESRSMASPPWSPAEPPRSPSRPVCLPSSGS